MFTTMFTPSPRQPTPCAAGGALETPGFGLRHSRRAGDQLSLFRVDRDEGPDAPAASVFIAGPQIHMRLRIRDEFETPVHNSGNPVTGTARKQRTTTNRLVFTVERFTKPPFVVPAVQDLMQTPQFERHGLGNDDPAAIQPTMFDFSVVPDADGVSRIENANVAPPSSGEYEPGIRFSLPSELFRQRLLVRQWTSTDDDDDDDAAAFDLFSKITALAAPSSMLTITLGFVHCDARVFADPGITQRVFRCVAGPAVFPQQRPSSMDSFRTPLHRGASTSAESAFFGSCKSAAPTPACPPPAGCGASGHDAGTPCLDAAAGTPHSPSHRHVEDDDAIMAPPPPACALVATAAMAEASASVHHVEDDDVDALTAALSSCLDTPPRSPHVTTPSASTPTRRDSGGAADDSTSAASTTVTPRRVTTTVVDGSRAVSSLRGASPSVATPPPPPSATSAASGSPGGRRMPALTTSVSLTSPSSPRDISDGDSASSVVRGGPTPIDTATALPLPSVLAPGTAALFSPVNQPPRAFDSDGPSGVLAADLTIVAAQPSKLVPTRTTTAVTPIDDTAAVPDIDEGDAYGRLGHSRDLRPPRPRTTVRGRQGTRGAFTLDADASLPADRLCACPAAQPPLPARHSARKARRSAKRVNRDEGSPPRHGSTPRPRTSEDTSQGAIGGRRGVRGRHRSEQPGASIAAAAPDDVEPYVAPTPPPPPRAAKVVRQPAPSRRPGSVSIAPHHEWLLTKKQPPAAAAAASHAQMPPSRHDPPVGGADRASWGPHRAMPAVVAPHKPPAAHLAPPLHQRTGDAAASAVRLSNAADDDFLEPSPPPSSRTPTTIMGQLQQQADLERARFQPGQDPRAWYLPADEGPIRPATAAVPASFPATFASPSGRGMIQPGRAVDVTAPAADILHSAPRKPATVDRATSPPHERGGSAESIRSVALVPTATWRRKAAGQPPLRKPTSTAASKRVNAARRRRLSLTADSLSSTDSVDSLDSADLPSTRVAHRGSGQQQHQQHQQHQPPGGMGARDPPTRKATSPL